MSDSINLPGNGSIEHSQEVIEGGKFDKLVLPYA
jgi:hypothetical protein